MRRALELAQQGTGQRERQSGAPTGKLVNVAGRQRLRLQRIARTSLFRAWSIATPQMTPDLDGGHRQRAAACRYAAAVL
ncbi:hypothetical protein [Ralstonia pseudosolanacearum]